MAKIYQTFDITEAQYKIYITSNKGEADLWVYNVSNRGLSRGDSHWYVTKNKEECTSKLFFSSRGMASLIVFFVNSQGEAGWQKEHKLRGRL